MTVLYTSLAVFALVVCCLPSACCVEFVSSCVWNNQEYRLYNFVNGAENATCPSGSTPLVISSGLEASVMTYFPALRLDGHSDGSTWNWHDGSPPHISIAQVGFVNNVCANYPQFKDGALGCGADANHFVCEASDSSNTSSKPCIDVMKNVSCSEFQGHCYTFGSTVKAPFVKAQGLCMKHGGYMVTLNSQEELDFVDEMRNNKNIWIGLTSLFTTKPDLSWDVTEEEITIGIDTSDKPWTSGQPDRKGNEYCILWANRGWEDWPCNFASGSIGGFFPFCEIDRNIRVYGDFIPSTTIVEFYGIFVTGNATLSNTILVPLLEETKIVVQSCLSGLFSLDATGHQNLNVIIQQAKFCEDIPEPTVSTKDNQIVSTQRSTTGKYSVFTLQVRSSLNSSGNVAVLVTVPLLIILIIIVITSAYVVYLYKYKNK